MKENLRKKERRSDEMMEMMGVPQQAVCSGNSTYVQAVSAEYEVQHVFLVCLI